MSNTPLSEKTFPHFIQYEGLYFKLIGWHLPPSAERADLLENLRREAADNGEWESISDEMWGAALEMQHQWDLLMTKDPVKYAAKIEHLRIHAISACCHKAILADMVANREDRSKCDWMAAIKSVLVKFGVAGDPRFSSLLEKAEDDLKNVRADAAAGVSMIDQLLASCDENEPDDE